MVTETPEPALTLISAPDSSPPLGEIAALPDAEIAAAAPALSPAEQAAAAQHAAREAIFKAKPLHIFGAQYAQFTLNGRVFHYAKHTTAGVIALRNWIQSKDGLPQATIEGSIGEMVIAGIMETQRWEALDDFFKRACVPSDVIPEGVGLDTDPTELVEAIDLFFEQSGFNWLARAAKNSASLALQAMSTRNAALMEAATQYALRQAEAEAQTSNAPTP